MTRVGAMLALAVACGTPPPPPDLVRTPTGLTVHADAGITRVRLVDPAGVPLAVRRLPAPVDTVEVRHRWVEPGDFTVLVDGVEEEWALSLPVRAVSPVDVAVEAPVGQARQPVADGEVVPLTILGDGPATVAVRITPLATGPARVAVGGAVTERARLLEGERLVVVEEIDGPTDVVVEAGGATTRFALAPRRLSLDAARETLRLTGVVLPARGDGGADLGRPQDRVSLPSAWWASVLRSTGLGFRPRDPSLPWAFVGVTLDNKSDQPVNVVLRMRILDEEGAPAPAFRPRLRGQGDDQHTASALLRVPAGRAASGALPLFVDEGQLDADTVATHRWTRELAVLPMGASEPLLVDRQPLFVSRGGSAASLGLVGGLGAALLGALLVLARGRAWLRERPTSELMTIGLFSALTFLVGALGRVLTMGLAAVLGPFATLLTGLIDDAFRYTLLATLVTLLPRPGTLALAVLTGWILNGALTGGFGPTDLAYVAARVLFLEVALWLSGVTRVRGWQGEAALRRWLRLATGFGVASVLSTASGMAIHMVLYRLFYADWYVALVVGGPGFLYVLVACAIAVPFAASLREVQR